MLQPVEILDDEIAEDSPRREFVHIAKIEIERIDKLVGEFVHFARPPKLFKTSANINELIRSVVVLLKKQAAELCIHLEYELSEEFPDVELDPEQIEQVLLNLALNAFGAIPKGGTVIFRTLQDAKDVIVEVEDTGGGIAPEALDRIFDPFFTTKDKGSGLGLSIAHKIATQHEGKLSAENTKQGALFRLVLPKATK